MTLHSRGIVLADSSGFAVRQRCLGLIHTTELSSWSRFAYHKRGGSLPVHSAPQTEMRIRSLTQLLGGSTLKTKVEDHMCSVAKIDPPRVLWVHNESYWRT